MKKDDKTNRLMRSKTDQRYWLDRLRKRVRKVKNSQVIDPDFSVQIALGNKKERVKLATANKSEAAARAASFYRSLVADGWEAAYAAHEFSRAGRRGKARDAAAGGELPHHTLGALFSAYEKVTNTRSSTLSAYKKALRKIYSEIGEINGAGRFKTATTGNRVWKEKVDQLPLTTVTSESLQEWKQLQLCTDCTLDENRHPAPRSYPAFRLKFPLPALSKSIKYPHSWQL